MLKWDDGQLIFDLTPLFCRAMAGITLLRDGSTTVAWLKVM